MTGSSANSLLRDLSGRRLGRYEVLMQLASGGMATVYVARAQGVAGFERMVAVKVLHPHLAHDEEFISMFLDEARLAARIRHPNVVPTLDISDTQGDGFFLVMEYIEGDHLGAILREAARAGTPLPLPVVSRIVIDALEGLGAAHTLSDDGTPLGIVHRDVSPHNVLVGTDGSARITDFGVAKAEVRLSSTRDGQFKGKLSYMAPEQASTGSADQRSDLFSMGIVLWESLTGRRLFRADNNGELLNRLLNDPITPPSTYKPEAAAFDEVCLKSLEREPEARYQSADEFVEALEQAAAKTGGIASPRVVGRLVKELLGPKIEAQIARIRSSGEALGKSQLQSGTLPLPEAGGTSPSRVTRPMPPSGAHTPSAVRTIATEDATMGAKPSNLEVLPAIAPPEKKGPPWVAIGAIAAVLLLLTVGVAAFAVLGGGDDAVATAEPGAAQPSVAREPSGTEPSGTEPSVTGATEAVIAPVAPIPPVAEAAPVAEVAPVVEPAPVVASPRESSRSGRRRGARGAGSSGSAGGAGEEEDDDLLVNPYRR